MRYKSKEHFAEELAKAIGTDILNKVESLKKAWLKRGQEHLSGMLDDKGNLKPVAQPMLAGHDSGRDPGSSSSPNHSSSSPKLKLGQYIPYSHSQKLKSAVAAANQKLKDAGVTVGGYDITSAGTPSWDYDYNEKNKKAIDEAHALIAPHLPAEHEHEDHVDTSNDVFGTRFTHGGVSDHVQADHDAENAAAHAANQKLKAAKNK